ncbi:L,D-transpeptidase Cds6 family protein [Helicobacter felis]|uniref:L,D-transpeptidase Cds6 family protein n=1 Tax=Helicobacter felis TaxID=214 RepID=UPI0018F8520E|nr:L,D-transpeptidase family protein [Helicobacter felis]
MLKRVLWARVLLVAFLCAVGLRADTLMGFVKAYHKKGIASIERLLQSYLTQKEFWEDVLEKHDISYGYYEDLDYLFVINKADPKLILYALQGEKIVKVNESTALVGSKTGEKITEGDKATPIGVYQILKKLTGLDAYYGPFALETNYPNPFDVARKRNGHGIWIHGLPLDGKRDELNTKGCIAIQNPILKDYGTRLKDKKTLLIVYEGEFKYATQDELAALLSSLYTWRSAWAKNDLVSYMNFYAPDFKHANGMDYKTYEKFKTHVFGKNEDKTIRFSKVNITPYPNNDHKRIFRIAFDQDYDAYKNKKLVYSSHGTKVLFVALEKGKMQILVEK